MSKYIEVGFLVNWYLDLLPNKNVIDHNCINLVDILLSQTFCDVDWKWLDEIFRWYASLVTGWAVTRELTRPGWGWEVVVVVVVGKVDIAAITAAAAAAAAVAVAVADADAADAADATAAVTLLG